MFGEKVNAIINEYAGKEALGIKFISEPEDKLTIFANVFKESPFSFSYPIRSIGYCERQIAEYNLTTEEQIACIFHEIGHIVRGNAWIAGQNRQLYVFVRRNKRFTGQGDFEKEYLGMAGGGVFEAREEFCYFTNRFQSNVPQNSVEWR